MKDALSKIKGDLIQDKRTSKAMDSFAKKNTISNQPVKSGVGNNSKSTFREEVLMIQVNVGLEYR